MNSEKRCASFLGLSQSNVCFGIVALICTILLAACNDDDANIHKQISGNWVIGKHYSVTFNLDGSYNSSFTGASTNSLLNYSGQWAVKDGYLITHTKISPIVRGTTNLIPDNIIRRRVVKIDESSLFLTEGQGLTNTYIRK